METTEGKIVFNKIRWRIERHENPRRPTIADYRSRPTCITCQVDLKSRIDGQSKVAYWCQNPMCSKSGQEMVFHQSDTELHNLAVRMWEGANRIKEPEKWLNLDQELSPITDKRGDEDELYWSEVKFFNTKRGKMLMVLVGKKGHSSKVQFFVKDEEDQVTSDQVGDINPKEIFLGFKAFFSDGATNETKHSD